jgi:hypothetical protein
LKKFPTCRERQVSAPCRECLRWEDGPRLGSSQRAEGNGESRRTCLETCAKSTSFVGLRLEKGSNFLHETPEGGT